MGNNYNYLPKRPPIPFNHNKHQFETTYVQRIKQTPFSYSQPYSIEPPIFIDSIDLTMRQLVMPRVTKQQFFPPNQIVKIISNVLSGLLELQEHQFLAHGDLSFDTIYYDKRTKVFKITHPLFSPQSGYQMTKLGKRFSLLSPQQLISLTDPEYSVPNIVSFKSDLFVLGVLMLQICTLIPSSQIYCPDTYIIFDKQIQNRFQLIRQYYHSQPLCQKFIRLISQLLQYDQSVRKTTKEILWQLQQLDPTKNAKNMIPQGRLIPSSPKQGAPLQTMPGAPNIHTMQGMGNIQAPPGFTGAMQGNNFIRR